MFYLSRTIGTGKSMYELRKLVLDSDIMIEPDFAEIQDEPTDIIDDFKILVEKFNDWKASFTRDALNAGIGFVQHLGDSFQNALYEENFFLRTLLFADFLTLTTTTSFLYDMEHKYYSMLDDPTLFNGLNFFLMGIPEMLDGTFNPDEPLSFQHVMDILGTVSLLYGGKRLVDKLDELGFDNRGSIELFPNGNKNNNGNLLGMAIPDMDDALEKAAREFGDSSTITTAEYENNFLAKNFGDDLPYWNGTKVFTITLKENTSFVRFYGGGKPPSILEGIWVMKESDIIGLSIEEIVDKYALPSTPTNMGYVYISSGEKIKVSCANGIYNHNGGGIQYCIEKYPPPNEWFYNERK